MSLYFLLFCILLEWAWDANSDLIKLGEFELSGPDNSIATKIDQDMDDGNCMMTGPVMEGTGKHTISMKLGKGDSRNMGMMCGVARDGGACDTAMPIERILKPGTCVVTMGIFGAMENTMMMLLAESKKARC